MNLPALALVAALLARASDGLGQSPPPQGIILISIDDLRRDGVGCYAPAARAFTPLLDRFARESVLFEQAISQATWTLPAHASLLTSLYPSSHGAGGVFSSSPRPLLGSVLTLPDILRRNGYKTAGFADAGLLGAHFGFAAGFDSYLAHVGEPHARSTFQDAAEWIKANGRGKFFVFLHSYLVHDYLDLDPSAEVLSCPPRLDPNPAMPPAPDPRVCRAAAGKYGRATYCMDRTLGGFLAEVDRMSGKDRPLVVITADHGEALCEPHEFRARWGHGGQPYEGVVRVPLLMRFPGARWGARRVAAAVSLIDVAPTILDAAQIALPADFQGRSLIRLIEGGPPPAGPIFIEGNSAGDDWEAVRTDRYKYILHGRGREELYDLVQDPGETDNRALREPKTAGALKANLRTFIAGQRMGFHLAAKADAGDTFTIRVHSAEPLTEHRALFAEGSDTVTVADGGRGLSAVFKGDTAGDEDWLSFAVASDTAPLVLEVAWNGRPLAAGRLYMGDARTAAGSPLDLNGRDAAKSLSGSSPPSLAAGDVAVWRGGRGAAPKPAELNGELLKALRAAGYVR